MRSWAAAALLALLSAVAAWPSGVSAANGDGLAYLFDQALNDPLDPYENVESFNKTFRRDGYKRNTLYLKPVTPLQEQAPLLVVLHYRGGNAKDMANLIEVGKLVRDFGAWAVLPEALAGSWKKNPAQASLVDDVGYIEAVIQDALANYPVDPKRVYIAGYSDGAFMTLRFACEHSDLLAGGFAVAGAMLKSLADVCAPTTTLPMVFINGTSDMNVNYDGSFGVLSAPESAQYWASLNACTQAAPVVAIPDIADDRTTTSMLPYRECLDGKDVDFYTVQKGGHTWPGVNPFRATLGRVSYDFDGTLTMWEFFQQYRRP